MAVPTTLVTTPPATLPLTLAAVRAHLNLTPGNPGTKATVVFGTGNAQLVLTAKDRGAYANAWAAELVAAVPDQELAVAFVDDKFTAVLATDGAGAATSTAAEVAAAFQAEAELLAIVDATTGTGDGSGVLAAAVETLFVGGTDVTSEDAHLELLVGAATAKAETLLRKKLVTQTLTHVRDTWGGARIPLLWGPVQSITTVKYYDADAVLQTVDGAQYTLRNKTWPQTVELHPDYEWPDLRPYVQSRVEIEYVTGYTTVPADVKMALLLMIGHWYSHREDVQTGPGLVSIPLPNGAKHLLWPLRDFSYKGAGLGV